MHAAVASFTVDPTQYTGLATDVGTAIKDVGVAIILALAPFAVGLHLARRAISWAFGMVG